MDDYPWDAGRTPAERTFLARLAELSSDRAFFDAWTFYPQLVVTVSIADPDENLILRTLRVDYDGTYLRGGNDPSHQIDPELDPNDPDYFALTNAQTPRGAAEHTFTWFAEHAQRPIVRQEWDGPDHTWVQWMLVALVDRPLAARVGRPPARPPDRMVPIPAPRL